MFKTTANKGFHMTFDNGVTISVQFGYGNYCDNRDLITLSDFIDTSSSNAEIMIWNDDKVITNELFGDDVQGYLSANEVLKAMIWASNYQT